MADDKPADAPEIDVDALSDADFTELKGKMRAEQPTDAPPETKPTAEAPKADKPAPEPADDDSEPDGKAETVPHGQFHRERERRKEAERLRAESDERFAKLAQRTQELLAGQQPQEPQYADEPAIPDPDVDPHGAIKWLKDTMVERQKREAEQATEARQQTEQQQAFQQAFNKVNADYNSAVTADPSIVDAHAALRTSLKNELLANGYPPEQIDNEIVRIENQHLMFVAQTGRKVGDHIKGLASARGWQPKAAPASEINAGMTDAQKIAQREETRLASQSLGKGGGEVANTGVMTPQELLDMSDADFAAYKKKHGSVARAFAA